MTDSATVPYMNKTVMRYSVHAHSGLYTFKAPLWWQPVGLSITADANPVIEVFAEVEELGATPLYDRTLVIYQVMESHDPHNDEIFIGMVKHPYAGHLFVYERAGSRA